MKNISININELIKIKTDLEKSLNAWDPLLNGIDASLLKEDWKFIHDIEVPVAESLERIKRILQLAKIESGVKNALEKFNRHELIKYI